MSVYRFLEDAFIGGLYYQAGTTASTADVGGTLPINWVPNGNIDPVDTAAFNAMQAAGPQPQGPIITQFSALPVAPPNTRWVQNPVTGQFTLVQGVPPYVLRPLFFDGKTWLVSFGPLGTLNIPKVTFAGWFNTTDWDRSSTIWVTDPARNNNPFFKLRNPAFVLYIPDHGVYYSADAVNWTKAKTPVDTFPALGQGGSIPLSGPIYLNGLWVFSYQFNTGGGPFGAVIYSYDAKNWTLGFQGNTSNFYTSVLVPGHGSNPAGSNQIQLSNINFVPPSQVQVITIPCTNAPGAVTSFDDNNFSFGDVLVDPSQGGGSLTFGGSNGFYASISLPPGITAIRFTEPSNAEKEEYTSTPITQAIVNGNFAGASWNVGINISSIGGGSYFNAPPSTPPQAVS